MGTWGILLSGSRLWKVTTPPHPQEGSNLKKFSVNLHLYVMVLSCTLIRTSRGCKETALITYFIYFLIFVFPEIIHCSSVLSNACDYQCKISSHEVEHC